MRSLDIRLRKLEAGLGSSDERPLFYVFGVDEADLRARVAAEIAAGRIRLGNSHRMVIWRGASPPPPARWTAPSDLRDDELEDAIATLAQQVGFPVHPRGIKLPSLLAGMDTAAKKLAA